MIEIKESDLLVLFYRLLRVFWHRHEIADVRLQRSTSCLDFGRWVMSEKVRHTILSEPSLAELCQEAGVREEVGQAVLGLLDEGRVIAWIAPRWMQLIFHGEPPLLYQVRSITVSVVLRWTDDRIGSQAQTAVFNNPTTSGAVIAEHLVRQGTEIIRPVVEVGTDALHGQASPASPALLQQFIKICEQGISQVEDEEMREQLNALKFWFAALASPEWLAEQQKAESGCAKPQLDDEPQGGWQ